MIRFLKELAIRNRVLYYFGWLNLAAAVASVVMIQITGTQVLGINAWIKPLKFFLSTTIFTWTIAWLLYYLDEPRKVSIFSWMAVLVLSFENIYILLRAARGELSHFNVTDSFSTIMFTLMGIALSVMTIWTGYFGYLFFKRDIPGIRRHYLWGIRFGILFFVIFALGGNIMAALMGHTVGAPDGGEGIPFVNWSRQHGDLRVAHFMGMHAMQILPLLGYYVSRRSIITVLLSLVYFLIVLAVFLQALISRPLIEFYLA